MAAQNMPAPIHGLNISQHNELIINAIDSDSNIFPYSGCCEFGKIAYANGKSIIATDNNSDVHVTAKNNKTQPMNRSPHDCNFRS